MDSASAASAGRLPCRAHRRRPVLRSLSDAQFPERPCGSGGRGAGARCARARGRTAPADGRRAHRGAARAADRTHAHAARAAREGFRAPARRSRRNISRMRSARLSARTRSSSTNIRCVPTIARAKSPARFSRSGPPADLAGASAQRLALNSRRPTSSSSRRWATAPTCSPTRWSVTGCRPFMISRS